jgi:hypothetical protein
MEGGRHPPTGPTGFRNHAPFPACGARVARSALASVPAVAAASDTDGLISGADHARGVLEGVKRFQALRAGTIGAGGRREPAPPASFPAPRRKAGFAAWSVSGSPHTADTPRRRAPRATLARPRP